MFFDPHRLNPTDDYVDEVLVVLPAEWAALHQRDGETDFSALRAEISDEIERLHSEIRVTLAFKRSREEQESGLTLRCFISPVGRVQQFVLGYSYAGQDVRFGAMSDAISGITRSYYQRVINPAS